MKMKLIKHDIVAIVFFYLYLNSNRFLSNIEYNLSCIQFIYLLFYLLLKVLLLNIYIYQFKSVI